MVFRHMVATTACGFRIASVAIPARTTLCLHAASDWTTRPVLGMMYGQYRGAMTSSVTSDGRLPENLVGMSGTHAGLAHIRVYWPSSRPRLQQSGAGVSNMISSKQ